MMTARSTGALTLIAMLAFAANSLLCRVALSGASIDPASFTLIRLASGACVLWVLAHLRRKPDNHVMQGSWTSAGALFVYAAGFSFAYASLSAATGALVLFGVVQVTMIACGVHAGERLRLLQVTGLLLAFAGLVGLLLPGISAPPLRGVLLMTAAGIAWSVYSWRGKRSVDPVGATAGNFLRAVPFAVVPVLATMGSARIAASGAMLAIASGAFASGLGYAIWYAALPRLRASTAAGVQLVVPVLAATGGVLLLAEPLSLRLLLASAAVIGGIAISILGSAHMADPGQGGRASAKAP